MSEVESQQSQETNGSSKFDVPEIELIIKVSEQRHLHTPAVFHFALRKFPCRVKMQPGQKQKQMQTKAKTRSDWENANCRLFLLLLPLFGFLPLFVLRCLLLLLLTVALCSVSHLVKTNRIRLAHTARPPRRRSPFALRFLSIAKTGFLLFSLSHIHTHERTLSHTHAFGHICTERNC